MKKGSHHSLESREKMKRTDEAREEHKLAKIEYYKKHPETKEKISHALLGRKKSPETRAKLSLAGHRRTREKGPSWNGGLCDGGKKGRPTIYMGPGQHRKSQSRHVMEQYLGRKLSSEEVVHHIDKNPKNNDIENLMLFKNQGEHRKFHHLQEVSNVS